MSVEHCARELEEALDSIEPGRLLDKAEASTLTNLIWEKRSALQQALVIKHGDQTAALEDNTYNSLFDRATEYLNPVKPAPGRGFSRVAPRKEGDRVLIN